MKKVIKLTESDLARIVKRVIREQSVSDPSVRRFNLTNGQQISVKLAQIQSQEDLDTFLKWGEGRGPVTTLKGIYPKGLTAMPPYPTVDDPDQGTEEMKRWQRWNMLTTAIDTSLRLIAQNGTTPTNSNWGTVVTSGMKPEIKRLVENMGKTYMSVLEKIYNNQIAKLG